MTQSASKKTANGSHGNEPIVEHLYEIIDSKIQFIEYRTNEFLNAYLNEEAAGEPVSDYDVDNMHGISISSSDNEYIFSQIEMSSKSIHRLLQFKSVLTQQNALLILELLTDNKYMDCTDFQIHEIMVTLPSTPV